MNAVSEMSIWLVASLVIIFQLQAPGADSLTAVYRRSSSGRKLFGGYRIVPKPCSATIQAKRSAPKTGVCMFNYECTQHGGELIGSCIDGFLFGTCCALPPSVSSLLFETDYVTPLESDGNVLHQTSARPSLVYNYLSSTTKKYPTTDGVTQRVTTVTKVGVLPTSEEPDMILSSFLSGDSSYYAETRPQQMPILEQYLNNENQGQFIDNYGYLPVHKYPVADTVLLNPDGSAVVDESDPELLFTRPTYSKISSSSDSKNKPTTEKSPSKPATHGTFIAGGYGSQVAMPQMGQVASNNKVQVTIEGDAPERPVTTSRRPETHKTTKTSPLYRPTERYPTTPPQDGNLILMHTLSTSNKTTASTKFSYGPTPTPSSVEADKYPAYDYSSYSGLSKPPVIVSGPLTGFDNSGEAINHIINILNVTHTSLPVDQATSSGLSTWVQMGGDKTPGTSSTHRPGYPGYTGQSKPVPTVIVISQPNAGASVKPSKKPVVVSSTKKPVRVTLKPQTSSIRYPETVSILPTGQESLINFPPVRNPDLNVSSLNQLEKPTIVHSSGYPIPEGVISSIDILPDNADLNTIDPDEDYSDFTTPPMDDEKVDVKIHNFVEKIVNSLAGNFQDLEGLLIRNENKTTLPNQNGIELTNVQLGNLNAPESRPTTTTKKPPRRTTTEEYDLVTEPETATPTKRPRPTTRPTTAAITTVAAPNTSKRPAQTSTTKRPTSPTKKPTAVPVTTRPTSATTRRPTTKRPKPTPTTTKRPRPTTTTEAAVTEPATTQISEEQPTVDFRKECGVRPMVKKNGRIVGGKGSQFGHYPWQVLVRESTWLGLFTKNKCGGVLITHKYVITAAHCQPGFLASLVAVFGEFDISGDLESKRSVTKNVRRVIVHRQYDPATFENDLALLELDSPIAYDEHIVPICMPREGEDYTGRMATVTGWGRLKYGGGVPSVLQEVRVPLIDNSVCQEMFHTAGHQKRIISSFLCAGYANGQKDSCEGDSGGPLMVERDDGHWVLLGTVSHGIKCAAPYLPGVYMRTTYYKPWLKSITGVTS